MSLRAPDESSRVVGYEWDLARRVLAERGLVAIQSIISSGDGIKETGPLRVVRQRDLGEGRIELTCAYEDWQAVP